MPVYRNIPQKFYRCNDGTYSDHKRPGACNWHSGLKTEVPVTVKQQRPGAKSHSLKMRPGDVVLVPIQSINVRREWFQGRATPYSDRSVKNIIAAVDSGRFLWANLDPLTLWAAPDGKLYVLSGHSRLEAFTRLCKAGATAQGKNFCSIPAKIEENISLAQAKEIALQSNTLSTKETPLERAAYYATLRAQGKDEKAIQATAKRLEGRNYTSVIAYSYLDPLGKTYAALQALDQGNNDSSSIITSVARWIGNARRNYPLTNHHESELYDWLINRRGYGTGRGQVSNERDFKERLASIINRRMTFGHLEDSLNIQAFLQRSPVEQQYDQQLNEAKSAVREAETALKAKIKELTSRAATETQIQQVTQGLEATLRRARIRYQELIGKRGDVAAAARNELSLFAGLGRIGAIVDTRPPGRTLCMDDMYSTLPHGPGVCSYHGGSTQTKRRKAPESKKASKTHTYKYKLGDRVKVDRGDFTGSIGTVINAWFDPDGNEWVTLYFGTNLGSKKMTASVSADLTHLATREEDNKIYWEKAFYVSSKLIAELGFRGISYQLKFLSSKPYDFDYTPKTSFSNQEDFADFRKLVHKNQAELLTATIDRVGRDALPASFFVTEQLIAVHFI